MKDFNACGADAQTDVSFRPTQKESHMSISRSEVGRAAHEEGGKMRSFAEFEKLPVRITWWRGGLATLLCLFVFLHGLFVVCSSPRV